MAQGKKLDNGIVLNQWELHLEPWCPAQIYYYFKDSPEPMGTAFGALVPGTDLLLLQGQ